MTADQLPDVAYAAALSALPEMTPVQLTRLLGDEPAQAVYERVAACDVSLLGALVAIGRRRPAAPKRADPPPGSSERTPGPPATEAPTLFEPAIALERRRQSLLVRLRSWSHNLARSSVEGVWASLLERGIAVVRRGQRGYPARLLRADHPPELLYAMGSLSHTVAPAVAIVGTRRATHYGMEVAGEMGQALAERRIAVVSGLAKGIDTAAHVGFLSARERSIGPVAVVGGGVDVVYPAENRRLRAAVCESGALISEAPPGAPPEGWRFPLRNRIIAALSQVVVVVESSRQGGAMHTVQAADSYGIPVLAVPGSVRSPQSEGTNAIIAEGGAGLATDVYDVLTALSLVSLEEGTMVSFSPVRPERAGGTGRAASSASPQDTASRASRQTATTEAAHRTDRRPSSLTDVEPARRGVLGVCTELERNVYAALEHTPTTFDVVCARTRHDVGTVALALDHLEELGLARAVGPSWRRV